MGPRAICTRSNEEKSLSLRRPGSNPSRPAHSQAPCHLSYLSHFEVDVLILKIKHMSYKNVNEG